MGSGGREWVKVVKYYIMNTFNIKSILYGSINYIQHTRTAKIFLGTAEDAHMH